MAGADDRVVHMDFDNAEFERKLSGTLKSLGDLQKSLDTTASRQGLDDLAAAGNRFSMGNLTGSIEGVSGKFLAMATVGITALAQITTKAVEAGARFVSSFTFQPIMDGFHEFETNMGSIQTILANTKSKGSTLDDVNGSLAALNKYSDQTIYNFSEMARNIGTFTAAGVDLDKSTKSIKGIANLAALSGSSSEQASTAMYQLSQAMASGTVKLMDWNSVVNAGMGGESFQKALFDSGKAMKTLTNVPAGQTFEQWKKAGNSFRDSLQDGWVTADVLSTTLNGLSGDMSEAELKAKGYSAQQAKDLHDLGQTGFQAATQVKTLTQLISTVKEAVGSGWTQTFQILFGNFGESVQLFTEISNAIGKIVGDSADARNSLLQGWKDLGGRTELINGFKAAIHDVALVVGQIKKAFRDVFPPTTSKDLFNLTQTFHMLANVLEQALLPHLGEIRNIFRGLFAVVDIVREVFVQLFFVVTDIFQQFSGGGGHVLSFAATLGEALYKLDQFLVKGRGLIEFFGHVKLGINEAIGFVKDLFGPLDNLTSKFSGFGDAVKPAEGALDRINGRFEGLKTLLSGLMIVFEGAKKVLGAIWGYISDWFSTLGQHIAAALAPGDFNAAVDVLNVGLLGGIILMLKKFLGGLKNFDATGGIISKIKDSLETLNGTLKAMQTELKAKALEEIAIAIGILAASVLVLSLIDSAALAKAMTALATGFAILVTTMKGMDEIASNTSGAAKLVILATALNLVASSAVILSGAIAILGHLSFEELTKGMAALAGALALMIGAIKALEGDTAGVLAASVAMVAIATAMAIMAGAVALFGNMNWETLAKGLLGVAAALGIIVGMMMIMPVASTLAAGLAMIPLATGLVILSGAVKIFGSMSWGELLKGLVALAGALGIIALAMNAMPLTLPITAAGLILVAIALDAMVPAVKMMGSMSIGELAKGLIGIAALMTILAVAVNAMSGAIAGAAALLVVSAALKILAGVLIELGQLTWGEIVKGLAAIAGVIIVLGLSALVLEPLIPALLGLGLAMTLVGLGFTLFGAGAWLVAKALQAMAEVGVVAVKALIQGFELLLKALPEFVAVLVASLLSSSGDILNAAQLMLKILTVLLLQILDTVIQLSPKIAEALVAIITAALTLIRAKFPDVMQTIMELLIVMLTTIGNNMWQIVGAAVNLVVNFANALSSQAQRLVDAALNLLFSFIGAIGARANDIVGAGTWLLLTFLAGMINNIFRIADFAIQVIITFTNYIGANFNRIISAGVDLLLNFVGGIANNIWRIAHTGVDIIIAFLNAIGGEAIRLARGAADALVHFLNGLADAIRDYAPQIRSAGANIAGAIIDGVTGGMSSKAGDVVNKIKDVVGGAISGAKKLLGIGSPSKVFHAIGQFMMMGLSRGVDSDTTAENSVVAQAERIVEAFSETLSKIPDSLEGLDANPVITPVLDLTKVREGAAGLDDIFPKGPGIAPELSYAQARTIASTAEISSPSQEMAPTHIEQTFNQNNYSPESLSTNDIYKGTKSQIALMKEELNI